MNILHVVRQFEPSIGGLESFVRSMSFHQMQLGHNCSILTLNRIFKNPTVVLSAVSESQGSHVFRVPFFGSQRFFIPFVPKSILQPYDIIHVHNTDGFFDTLSFRRKKAPLVATTHGGFFHTGFMAGLKKRYFNQVTARTARRYKLLFANSMNDLRTFSTIHPNVVLLPNAIEPLGNFTAQSVDFLCLGRLATHKRIDRVIQVFAELRKTGPMRLLHIVGPEWDVRVADLENIAISCGVGESVLFHGPVPARELQAISRNCGFFFSGSEYEGFGMTLVEAMSVGLIPFVHPNASFRDLIGSASVGRLVDFSDTPQAARLISDAIESVDPVDRSRARTFAKRFSWPELAARSIEEYRQINPGRAALEAYFPAPQVNEI